MKINIHVTDVEVGRNLDELLVVSLQALVNQFSENEGGSSCDDTPTLKSIRIRVQILPVSGCLFISLHGFGSLTLISPGLNVTYYSILS